MSPSRAAVGSDAPSIWKNEHQSSEYSGRSEPGIPLFSLSILLLLIASQPISGATLVGTITFETLDSIAQPPPFANNQTVALTIRISNPPGNGTATKVRFGGSTMPYPGSLVNAQPGAIQDSCGFGSNFSAVANNNWIQLGSALSGPSIAPGQTCTLKVAVKSRVSTPSGGLSWQIANLKATALGTTNPFSGSFEYKIPSPTASATWNPNPAVRNSLSRFAVTIKNNDITVQQARPDAMTGVAATIMFGPGITVPASPNIGTSCVTGVVATTATSVSFVGGSVASGGSACAFWVDAIPTSDGSQGSNSGEVISDNAFSATIAPQTLVTATPVASVTASPGSTSGVASR